MDEGENPIFVIYKPPDKDKRDDDVGDFDEEFNDDYTLITQLLHVANIGLYISDYVMDVLVVYWLSQEPEIHPDWIGWTSAIIVVPLVFVNIFSIVWYHEDHIVHKGSNFCPLPEERSVKEKLTLILSHVCLIGPIVRQIQIIKIGRSERELRPRTENHCVVYMRRKYYERDLAYLNMIDSFTQDAPQLILQIYILLSIHSDQLQHWETAVSQLGSVVMSLLSLSLSLVSYSQAIRYADHSLPPLSLSSQLSQWLWRLFTFSSRIFVFCLFLSVYSGEFFMFLLSHYLLMLIWILSMRTNFCGSMDDKRRPVSEFVYNMVLAVVLIFDIVNIKEGPTRIKNLCYYILVTVENSLLVYFWWNGQATFLDVNKTVLVVTFAVLQTLGFCFLVFYYRRMHPKRPLPDKNEIAHFL